MAHPVETHPAMARVPAARSVAAETRAVRGVVSENLVDWRMIRILPSVDARDGESGGGVDIGNVGTDRAHRKRWGTMLRARQGPGGESPASVAIRASPRRRRRRVRSFF